MIDPRSAPAPTPVQGVTIETDTEEAQAARASDDLVLEQLTGDAYVSSLEELARLLVEEASLTDLLDQVLELTSRAIMASSAVSVTVLDGTGRYRTVAASTEEARLVDDAQYELGEGPCVDALESGEEHLLDDLTDLQRWPRFRERALALGFECAMAVPLHAGDRIIGALNVFAASAEGLQEDDRRLARRIAAPAAATLANATAYREAHQLASQLQEALEGRAIIDQAKGALMAHARCSADAAFARLRRASQERNVPLREVAAEIVHRASGGAAGAS